jgi:hypothetical protein
MKHRGVSYYYILLLVLIGIGTSRATEKIEGGFGVKLGDFFDPLTATREGSKGDGGTAYFFAPVNPFRSLTSYHVAITPRTKKIFAILAEGEFKSLEEAKMEQAVIMALLTEKYGIEKEQGELEKLQNMRGVSQGMRFVCAQIRDDANYSLVVMYYDSDLARVAESERIRMEKQKAAGSGL